MKSLFFTFSSFSSPLAPNLHKSEPTWGVLFFFYYIHIYNFTYFVECIIYIRTNYLAANQDICIAPRIYVKEMWLFNN